MNFINIAKAAIVECGGPGQPVCDLSQFLKTITNLFSFGLEIAFIMVVVSFVGGGLWMALSAGDEGRISQGRAALRGSFIGIIIIFSSWIFINTVIELFTNCTNWNVFGGIICT
ncbi:MAG TPA: hypothetical protein VI432_00395 [Candidatus Paceibacterota bacterium]